MAIVPKNSSSICGIWVGLGLFAASASMASSVDSSSAVLIRVDHSGKGDYKKIQEAINAVPSGNTENYFIWIKPGIYREKIVVPADKPFITLSGSNANSTIITWNDSGEIFQSATLSVLASNFVGRLLTIQNTYGAGAKAVALQVSGDKIAFYGCRIISYQDTLLDDMGRHYYKSCYIEGATDFICGNALSLFERCHIHSVSEGEGAITAQRRVSPEENTGFIFLGGRISGTGNTLLGRPWGDFSRVVFAWIYMPSQVAPQGWSNWNDPSKQSTVFYREYKCHGPGARRSGRVAWSQELSSQEAAPFLSKSLINGAEWVRPSPTHFRRQKGFAPITEKLDLGV
ncbi:putative pectinesterase 11 [Aristolochia californica]|uniref:putative pectinesterase 11 n=1 Tax=Aristolochia californica TaxID=171875 RepID=UPI0035E1B45C